MIQRVIRDFWIRRNQVGLRGCTPYSLCAPVPLCEIGYGGPPAIPGTHLAPTIWPWVLPSNGSHTEARRHREVFNCKTDNDSASHQEDLDQSEKTQQLDLISPSPLCPCASV